MPSPERPGTPTPGPPLPRWRVGAEDTFHHRRRVLIEEAHQVGGATGPLVWVRIAEAVPERASLIALAPTLAEAVRVMGTALHTILDGDCGDDPLHPRPDCPVCMAARALGDPAVVAALAALKGVVRDG